MNPIEKNLEYHELLMSCSDTSIYGSDELPEGYRYQFFEPGDEEEWVLIHIQSGEFMSMEEGLKTFHDFYDLFYNELSKRLFFVVSAQGEKVGTATISKLQKSEYGFDAVVDWFAIKKSHQGYRLSGSMINKFIKLANELGYKKIMLHTQTHTWLASELYLDFGFEPFLTETGRKGWQILKNITDHSELADITAISENLLYFDIAVKTKKFLDERFGSDYAYTIWHKNGRHDVEVNHNDHLYQFKYDDNEFRLEEVN